MQELFLQNLSQVINWVLTIILIAVGWFFGTRTERQHLVSLMADEMALADIKVSSERFFEPSTQNDPVLVVGSVVIAQDRFKLAWANVLSLFGKNLTVYESLLVRARREALVRAKYQAKLQGCQMIYGLRFETTEVNDGGGVEVLAYGTAVVCDVF